MRNVLRCRWGLAVAARCLWEWMVLWWQPNLVLSLDPVTPPLAINWEQEPLALLLSGFTVLCIPPVHVAAIP